MRKNEIFSNICLTYFLLNIRVEELMMARYLKKEMIIKGLFHGILFSLVTKKGDELIQSVDMVPWKILNSSDLKLSLDANIIP